MLKNQIIIFLEQLINRRRCYDDIPYFIEIVQVEWQDEPFTNNSIARIAYTKSPYKDDSKNSIQKIIKKIERSYSENINQKKLTVSNNISRRSFKIDGDIFYRTIKFPTKMNHNDLFDYIDKYAKSNKAIPTSTNINKIENDPDTKVLIISALSSLLIAVLAFAGSYFDGKDDILKNIDSNYLFGLGAITLFLTLRLISPITKKGVYYILIGILFIAFLIWDGFKEDKTPNLGSEVIIIASIFFSVIGFIISLREYYVHSTK